MGSSFFVYKQSISRCFHCLLVRDSVEKFVLRNNCPMRKSWSKPNPVSGSKAPTPVGTICLKLFFLEGKEDEASPCTRDKSPTTVQKNLKRGEVKGESGKSVRLRLQRHKILAFKKGTTDVGVARPGIYRPLGHQALLTHIKKERGCTSQKKH